MIDEVFLTMIMRFGGFSAYDNIDFSFGIIMLVFFIFVHGLFFFFLVISIQARKVYIRKIDPKLDYDDLNNPFFLL